MSDKTTLNITHLLKANHHRLAEIKNNVEKAKMAESKPDKKQGA